MIEFVIASILVELTPGPNITWLAVLGATRGRASALAAVAGICVGLAAAAIVAGLGLRALLYEVPQLFTALRWAGTLYLFYLAWDSWNDSDAHKQVAGQPGQQAFVQGIVSNVLNPKAYLFYVALLPRFVDASRDAPSQIALLSVIYVTIATAIHAAIAVMAGSIAGWLAHSPQAVLVRKGLALAIAAAAVWFFISTTVHY
jgi:threonine/homoserine/homoserine lactone efflux protein